MHQELRAGRLLVAMPVLTDPNFSRTVVLVIAHDVADGTIGVVLNRPSQTDVGDSLPHWEPLVAPPRVVFVGGPVGPTAAIGLARATDSTPGGDWVTVAGQFETVDLEIDPGAVLGAIPRVRVFLGYAGWGPGQLEAEVDEGAWMVLDAAPDDVLGAEPDRLWRLVLRRQGGRTAWLANVPSDLRQN